MTIQQSLVILIQLRKVKFIVIKRFVSGVVKAPITPINMTAGENARTSLNLVEIYVHLGFDAVKKSKSEE